jgi:hypothetical protein
MAEFIYKCTVSSEHIKKFSSDPFIRPYCCNKPMVRVRAEVQNPAQKTATPEVSKQNFTQTKTSSSSHGKIQPRKPN